MSEIGVGLVGCKFMGRTHSNSYRQVARFFEVDPVPRIVALCGRDEVAAREAANAHIIGYEHAFVHTMKDLLEGISAGKSPAPTFEALPGRVGCRRAERGEDGVDQARDVRT